MARRGVPFLGDYSNLYIKTGKRFIILLTLVFAFSFVVASVEVHNYSIGSFYSPFENISGEINLTIVGEEYDSLITSNDGDEIKLGDFLNRSGNLFQCSPPDCSNDYSSSNGVVDKTFSVSNTGNTYVGFVLNGEDIEVKSLSFKIRSDFVASIRRPLVLEFFEREMWKYSEFSDEYLSRDFGCYDKAVGSAGTASIGDVLYCEMISVADTDLMKVGVLISGSDTDILDMTVYPETGTGAEWACSYDPNVDDGCTISSDINDIFSAGDYQVCVSSENFTNYKIYDETVGNKCGFLYDDGPVNSSKDYGIYAQGVKYADASLLASVDFTNEDVIAAANELIGQRYGGDCSDGCVLPLAFSGVSQNARVYDVEVTFTKGGELNSENKVYDLDEIPVTLDFDSITGGVVDLGALGFSVSKTMKYIVSLSGIELFSEVLDILPAPIIVSIFPPNPPAGVPIRFFAEIDYDANKSLVYNWDFGDESSETTSLPYVIHTYDELKNYTLTLEVSAGGNLTSRKSFSIGAISPEEAVNETLGLRRDALNNAISNLANFPSWYKGALSKLIRADFFKGELDRLDKAMPNAFTDSDFVKIAEDLYALDVPAEVSFVSFENPYFTTNLGDVNIEPVQIISGSITGATDETYAAPILNWQLANIDVEVSLKVFSVSTYSGEVNNLFSVYGYDVKPKGSEESYFVINRPFGELFFNEAVGARKAGDDATIVILSGGSEKSIEFYYESSEPTSVFVSPRLSSIVIAEDVDTTCNSNFVCEPEYGENYNTCRSDCKPVGRAIVYVILSFIFVLVLYTGLQIWYKRRYEGFLFKDRRQSYNLLMYVTNARARGMDDDKIAAELRNQGWSSERITYIIRKSIGQRTGLYEIIPVVKVMAYFRNSAAKKRVATGDRQQMGRNINKSRFPQRV